MRVRYFFGLFYWKLIYQFVLANKIQKTVRTGKSFDVKRGKLGDLFVEWRRLRTKYDGAKYDKKGYWIH